MSEQIKTLVQLRAYARELYLDVDTVDQALGDGTLNDLLNDWAYAYLYAMDRGLEPATTPVSFSVGQKVRVFDPSTAMTSGNSVIRIARIMRSGSYPLKVDEVEALIDRQFNEGKTGPPTEVAFEQVAPSGGTSQPIKFNLYVYPVPDATYTVTPICQMGIDLNDTDGDQFPLTGPEVNIICRLAASEAAMLTGSPDLQT